MTLTIGDIELYPLFAQSNIIKCIIYLNGIREFVICRLFSRGLYIVKFANMTNINCGSVISSMYWSNNSKWCKLLI